MNKRILKLQVILFGLVLLAGCAAEEGSQQIDQSYMETERYSEFEQQSKEEILHNEQNTQSFTGNLQQLSQCKQIQKISFPFTIDQERLNQLENVPETCTVESHQKPSYTVKAIAINEYKDLQLYWILLDRPSVYRNQGLFAATFQNDSLVNFNTIGSFEKDLSKEVTSEIQVRQVYDEVIISSTTHRKIIYPFEQENTVEESFIVTADGEVKIQK